MSNTIAFLIITLVIVIILLVIVINRTKNMQIYNYINSPYIGYIGYNCEVDSDCSNNLVCDPSRKTCVNKNYEKCQNKYECLSNSYCSGLCIPNTIMPSALTGNIRDPCPCNYDSQSCVNGICLSLTSCINNYDCVSGKCVNSYCS